jgi:four helix bundle protein
MYKKLEIWQESVDLVKMVYLVADELPKSEEYNLKSQLKRAVVSVALNIAEGKNRKSAKYFAHFLNVSSASLSEVDAILCICIELGFLQENLEISEKINILNRRINAFSVKLLREKYNV